MSDQPQPPENAVSALHADVQDRFGVLPNFFRLVPEAPEITENLWGFAKFGYLDNPLPSLFKERLFVYLSQFCEVRYCISRHVGFLIGLGRPSGDAACPPQTSEEIVRLIRRQFPKGEAFKPHLDYCDQCQTPLAELPEPDSFPEEAIFACAAHLFLQTADATRAMDALRRVLDRVTFQHLLVLLTFIRTAHFWTKVHPELQHEEDIAELLEIHEALAECCALHDADEVAGETTQILQEELIELRKEREQAELLRVTLASIGDGVIATDSLGRVTNLNAIAEELTGWSNADAYGKPVDAVFRIVNEQTRLPIENPVTKVLRDGGTVGIENHTILIAQGGVERSIDDSAAPIRRSDGVIIGCILVFRDVTQRRQAERDLLTSEERFRSFTWATSSIVWTTDADGGFVTPQPSWSEYTGQSWSELRDFGWIDALHPDDRESVQQLWKVARDSGSPYASEGRLWHAGSQSYRHFEARGVPIHDADGNVREWVGQYVDVEDRWLIEENLRDIRSRLESTLAAGEIGTWDFDPIHSIVRPDPNLVRMFDLGSDEQTSLESFLDAVHSEDRPRVTAAIDEALASGEEYKAEYRIALDGERVRWVVARGRVERDQSGKAIRLSGVVVDISERKRIEKALEESEDRVRSALEAAELGAWNIDPATSEMTTDERFRVIFQDCDKPITYEQAFEAIHPDDRQRVRDAVAAATNPREPLPYAEEYRVVHPSGAIRWVFGKGRASFEDIGNERRTVSFDGTVMDITEQRKMRDELRELAARLSEADRRKDEFLATLAHELRNPLAPIRSGLEVMKSAKDDPGLLEEVRSTMERQTQQLISLVDDLLDVSRITKGKLELRTCRVKLADVVRSAVESCSPAIEELNQELSVEIPGEVIELEADPHRLAQVLCNLLNNSTKYTPEGGKIRLFAQRQGNNVVVSVTDNGLGIPSEMQEQVFEMFAQIDRPQEKGYTGLGLGLPLVKSLVAMHGGSVEVQSEGPDKGSTFSVRLPVLVDASAAAQATAGAGHTATSSHSECSVLVVDDNKAAAKLLSMIIKSLGHEVRTAHDGQEAIEAAAEFLPKAILMDIGMPQMNGYEAARHIREQSWGQAMLLIALTGWGQEEDRQRTRQAGFDHHLVKPADPADVQELLSMANRP